MINNPMFSLVVSHDFPNKLSHTSAAEVLRRPRQLLLQLSREDLRAELWLGAGLNPGVFTGVS